MYTKTNRRNIIRQWFKYVIWANRLKKLQEKHKPSEHKNGLFPISFDLFDIEVLARSDYYTSIIREKNNRRDFFKLNPRPMLEDHHDSRKNNRIVQSVMNELEESQRKHTFSQFKKYYHEFLQRIFVNFRFQEIFFGKRLIFNV